MADLIEVRSRIDSISVPIPEVTVGTRTLSLPSFPGVSLPDLTLPDIALDLPTISVPRATVTVPSVAVRAERVALPSLPGFDLPVGVTARIEPTLATIDLPLVEESVTVVVGLELIGPELDTIPVAGLDLPDLTIPSVTVQLREETVGGAVVYLPDLRPPLPDLDLPDVPGLSLPSIPLPEVSVAVSSVPVPDPTTLRVTARLRAARLRRELLGDLPEGLLSDPTAFVFTAALAEVRRRLGDGLVPLLREIAEGILQVALSEETKERLRDQAGDG